MSDESKIKVEYVNTIEQVEQLFFPYRYDSKMGRYRALCVYRGLSDSSYELKTSLQRNCKDKKTKLESVILDNFAKYAEIENPTISDSVWRKMIIGQHHGLPTRLLDWTRSPLVALHFAMTEGNNDNLDKHDCVLWKLDVEELNKKLPEKYQKITDERGQKIFTVDMLEEACAAGKKDPLAQYDEDMGKTSMVILEPPSIDARIVNQYSFFSVVPSDVEKIEDVLEHCESGVTKYIISRNLRWQIRDMLDQANINDRVIYPGLDGIAKWLGRHYYVREFNKFSITTDYVDMMSMDAIVNSTDEDLSVAGGISNSIFKRAGEEKLKEACRAVGPIKNGQPVITDGFDLKAHSIIHVVCPRYNRKVDEEGNIEALKESYKKVLLLAAEECDENGEHKIKSIAFPLLGSGNKGFRTDLAWTAAILACKEYQKKASPDESIDITICTLETNSKELGNDILRWYEKKEEKSITQEEREAARLKYENKRHHGERNQSNYRN